MRRARIGIPVVLVLAIGGGIFELTARGHTEADGSRAFEGTWSASGRRITLATGGKRPAGIVQMAGAIVLESGDGVGRGFLGEAIGYDDGDRLSVGRALWTDERGDRIFSTLAGERLETGGRAVGTFTGGTGRYAGLTGGFVFEWKYVVAAEDGVFQGLAVQLKGRARFPEPPR